MEARARRGQKKSPDEPNQVIQVWYVIFGYHAIFVEVNFNSELLALF